MQFRGARRKKQAAKATVTINTVHKKEAVMANAEQDPYRKSREHVIAALDLDTMDEALGVARALTEEGVVTRFKIGSKLFTRCGPRILDRLGDLDAKVFLDLKYHDIPSVVGQACQEAARHEAVFLMTVHALGGAKMVSRAMEGARAGRACGEAPEVVAVTALTSHAQEEVEALGVPLEIASWAAKLGDLAMGAGASGLVCSAMEVADLRARFPEATLVTPGIRPEGYGVKDDQTRVVTPAEALASGSTYLVIGRPIYRARDPLQAATEIARSL
ncbi:MAG: orotidine-5'-phosphate decarboxylase [Myxococcota bacterium]|nr:orotidine-5'-phosphate decarboxylase [Myxococcota bacterium]